MVDMTCIERSDISSSNSIVVKLNLSRSSDIVNIGQRIVLYTFDSYRNFDDIIFFEDSAIDIFINFVCTNMIC